MIKRFFVPIWKIDKVENELAILESNGFRLNRISGLCRYEFVPCSPKNASYYFTINLVKENLMMNAKQSILQNNGNKINGSLYFGLCSTDVYRFTKGYDITQYNESRRASIFSVLKTRLWLNAFIIITSLFCLTADLITKGFPINSFKRFELIIILLIVIVSIIFFVYNMRGMAFLKKTSK